MPGSPTCDSESSLEEEVGHSSTKRAAPGGPPLAGSPRPALHACTPYAQVGPCRTRGQASGRACLAAGQIGLSLMLVWVQVLSTRIDFQGHSGFTAHGCGHEQFHSKGHVDSRCRTLAQCSYCAPPPVSGGQEGRGQALGCSPTSVNLPSSICMYN